VTISTMDGLARTGTASAGGLPPSEWMLAAVADFDRDGKGDFLWRSISGDTWIWLMDGPAVVSANPLGNPGLSWSIRAVSDFHADGRADILWGHADGSLYLWAIHNGSFMSANPVANPGGSWAIVAP